MKPHGTLYMRHDPHPSQRPEAQPRPKTLNLTWDLESSLDPDMGLKIQYRP